MQSVITELTVDADEFELGATLASGPPMHIVLERVVGIGDEAVPYFWAEGEDHPGLIEALERNPSVSSLKQLDELHTQILYRIRWSGTHDVIEGILESNGALLEAHGGEVWKFQVRFDDHDKLSKFYNYCTENDISIHVDRVYSLTEEYEFGRMFDLTQQQRQTLVLAARRGYFETPSDVTLDELGAELDISSQAVSKRIRGGIEKIITNALLSEA